MKKKKEGSMDIFDITVVIMSILFILGLLVYSLSDGESDNENKSVVKSESNDRFSRDSTVQGDKEDFDEYGFLKYNIIVDEETGCEYLFIIRTKKSNGLSPLLDINGSPSGCINKNEYTE